MSHPYASASYVGSLTHIGNAFAVPEWDGHVLARTTPDGCHHDAAGPYPIAVLGKEADLRGGFARLKAAGMVSVVVVLDDWLRPDLTRLEAAFDHVKPFKSHYIYDRNIGVPNYSKHHRYEIKRALKSVMLRKLHYRII